MHARSWDYDIETEILGENCVTHQIYDNFTFQVSAKRAQQWCQSKNDIPYFETSAKEGINVDIAFQTIAKNALAQEIEDLDTVTGFPSVQLGSDNNPRPPNDGCQC